MRRGDIKAVGVASDVLPGNSTSTAGNPAKSAPETGGVGNVADKGEEREERIEKGSGDDGPTTTTPAATQARRPFFCTPCGMCRQFLAEFCAAWVPVYMFDADGSLMVMRVGEVCFRRLLLLLLFLLLM